MHNKDFINASNYLQATIPASLLQKIVDLRSIMSNSSDLLINEILISGYKSAVICLEGMVSTGISTELIFHPLMRLKLKGNSSPVDIFSYIQKESLLSYDKDTVYNYGDMIRFLMSGFVIIFVDGVEGAIVLGVQGYEKRGISEPTTEVNVYGAQDGFVETVRVNMSLVRRRLKTPNLKFEIMPVGKTSKTDICIAYMLGKAPKKLVDKVKKSINNLNVDVVLSGGYLMPFLEGVPLSLFSGVSRTEKPDVLCSKINEGRVAIMIDGSPFALVVPTLFIENFQTMDDYSCRPFYGTYIRWLKYIAFFLATALPGVYVAVVTFHPETFNHALLLNLISAKELTPYSIESETLIITILYEIMREAGIRLPKAVGAAVGIVGGLVIGDAAVSSGLISAPLLIILGLTATSSYVISGLNEQTSILRILYIILGGLAGFYGIAVLTAVVIVNVCAMENYGVPYTAPVSPFTLKSMKDVFVRVGFKKLDKNVRVEALNGVTEYENSDVNKE